MSDRPTSTVDAHETSADDIDETQASDAHQPSADDADETRADDTDETRTDEAHETDADDPDDEPTRDDLEMRLEVLAAENRRLRERVADSRRPEHRRAGAGLVVCGLVVLAAAWVFTGHTELLVALGASGVFLGVLTIYLVPDRYVGADVYRTLARNHDRLVDELGLGERRVYVPTGGDAGVRLYVPNRRGAPLPDPADLDGLFVVEEDPHRRGIALDPAGSPLYDQFAAASPGGDPGSVRELVNRLGDAIVGTFEFADEVDAEVDPGGRRVSVAFEGDVYGPEWNFDHPLVSLVAVGLARHLDRPVDVEYDVGERNVVTFRWDSGESAGESAAESDAGPPA